MNLDVSKGKELRRLVEMLQNDAVLREILDLMGCPGLRKSTYEDLVFPYVNAPKLRGPPWK